MSELFSNLFYGGIVVFVSYELYECYKKEGKLNMVTIPKCFFEGLFEDLSDPDNLPFSLDIFKEAGEAIGKGAGKAADWIGENIFQLDDDDDDKDKDKDEDKDKDDDHGKKKDENIFLKILKGPTHWF